MTKPQDHSVGEQPTNPIITEKWVYRISNIQREYPKSRPKHNSAALCFLPYLLRCGPYCLTSMSVQTHWLWMPQ